jgi:hypothetical protein
MGWMHLASNKDQCHTVMKMVMNLRVFLRIGKFFMKWKIISFSRKTLSHKVVDIHTQEKNHHTQGK